MVCRQAGEKVPRALRNAVAWPGCLTLKEAPVGYGEWLVFINEAQAFPQAL